MDNKEKAEKLLVSINTQPLDDVLMEYEFLLQSSSPHQGFFEEYYRLKGDFEKSKNITRGKALLINQIKHGLKVDLQEYIRVIKS